MDDDIEEAMHLPLVFLPALAHFLLVQTETINETNLFKISLCPIFSNINWIASYK